MPHFPTISIYEFLTCSVQRVPLRLLCNYTMTPRNYRPYFCQQVLTRNESAHVYVDAIKSCPGPAEFFNRMTTSYYFSCCVACNTIYLELTEQLVEHQLTMTSTKKASKCLISFVNINICLIACAARLMFNIPLRYLIGGYCGYVFMGLNLKEESLK